MRNPLLALVAAWLRLYGWHQVTQLRPDGSSVVRYQHPLCPPVIPVSAPRTCELFVLADYRDALAARRKRA